MASSEISDLFNRLLGNPQANVTKAISTFVQEFETKRTSSIPDPNDSLVSDLRMVPETLKEAKTSLATDLEVTSAKDIDGAKEAFDEEMALRHADVIKQYVGTFV
ncbi:hypothetical protein BGZ81_010877 [Podila clonocystis]|nr:hypothetical protein BGZ81_010877 [Podila clonocystis]